MPEARLYRENVCPETEDTNHCCARSVMSVAVAMAVSCSHMDKDVPYPTFFRLYTFPCSGCATASTGRSIARSDNNNTFLILFMSFSVFCFLLSVLIPLRGLFLLVARHNQSKHCFCSRFLRRFRFHLSVSHDSAFSVARSERLIQRQRSLHWCSASFACSA